MSSFDLDDAGFPILLAPGSSRAPDVEELSDPTIPVESGNPHRAIGGRFGKGRGKAGPQQRRGEREKPGESQKNAQRPELVPLIETERRMDAVREAAREFETFERQDLVEWLRGRITRPLSEAEVDDFERDVRAQQLADISDVLDQMVRGEHRGRRYVKVKAPRGYVRKTLGALTDDELRHLGERLRARGWTEDQLRTGLVSRLTLKRRPALDAVVSPKIPS